MADTVDPEKKKYDDFVKKVKLYVELVKCYYEEGEVKLSEEDEELLHKIMINLINKLLKIRGESEYFVEVSVPHIKAIETTSFNLADFMGKHFTETPKFNSKRKTSKGRKSGRKTSKGRKSGHKTSKGRKVRN